jgi:multidrug resistance efflux pump
MRRVVPVVIVVAAAISALWWSQRPTGPYFVSGFIEADEIRLGSRVGGRVQEVRVVEGQRVEGGEVLVALEPYDLRERLAEAQANVAASVAALEKLRAGYRAEEIAQARARRDRFRAILAKLEAGQRPLEIEIKEDQLAEAAETLLRRPGQELRSIWPGTGLRGCLGVDYEA